MRHLSAQTRVRAWFLRTFRGRSQAAARWADPASAVSAGPARAFDLGGLHIDVTPRGLKAAGANDPAIVYDVRIERLADPRAWSSSYGFPPRQSGARLAADAALDELDEIDVAVERWWGRITAGMSEDEAEAMAESPTIRLDRRAAEWIAPELRPWRERRHRTGSWLEPDA